MQIFEYPYIIITIFVLCFIALSVVGVLFAVKGVKTVNGKDKKYFTKISTLESSYEKSGKLREERCILYIGVSLDSFVSLYSDEQAEGVFDEIKDILLKCLADEEKSEISASGETNFVTFIKRNTKSVYENVEKCQKRINECLSKHGALNIVYVRIGAYYVLGSQVSFDEAMNRAKQAYMLAENENITYAEWNVAGGKALENKIKIENSIEKEIDNNKFFLEYQPFLDARTKKIVGAEVLSRLNSETDGIITPGNFLSAVDSVGINNKFDYYIFEKNCKWISNDKEKREGYKYTINFSRSTMCEPDFADRIIAIAEKYNLNFSCLAVEILEDKSIAGEARKQMIANLSKLKENGISILLDDFGSGYTTFGDLQNFDISVVKIDKEITRNSTTDTGFIILKNIISTSKDIGFKTLCEGIETKEQEEAVIKAGCDLVQGYFYHKPMPVSMLEKLFD